MSFVADLVALVTASPDGRLSCPPGCARVQLGSLCAIVNGFPFASSGFGSIGSPVIRIRDVARGSTSTRFKGSVPSGFWVKRGDLLVGMDGDFCAATWQSDDALLNQRVCKIVPDKSKIDADYLRLILPAYLECINNNTPSVTVKHLSSRTLASIPIPLPTLEMQQKIANRICDLFTDLDDGEALLARARDDLGTWRKALLKAAVTGELTAEWRVANPSAETGADLLARILDERRARWLAEPRNRGKRYVGPTSPNLISSITLPENWTWASLAQIATEGPTNGYSPAKSKDDTGTLALKLTATTSGYLRLDEKSTKRLGETISTDSSLYLRNGDLLFQRGNTREYVGMAAIYDGPAETYIYPDLMIRIRTGSRVLTDWIWRWSNSPFGRAYLMNAAQGGAGTMPKISGETLRSMPIPFPPTSEQEQALRMIETAWTEQDALSASEKEASSSAINLHQSILSAAFRGDLVA